MKVIENLRSDLTRDIEKKLRETDETIVKGTLRCRGCGFESEARIESIHDLVDDAADHTEQALILDGDVMNHPVAFDVSLMPLPEMKEISAEINVEDGE